MSARSFPGSLLIYMYTYVQNENNALRNMHRLRIAFHVGITVANIKV
jgi:hypothetical protein